MSTFSEKPRVPGLYPISVAPMMDWTDRHCRYFLRGFTPHALLYTEMITAAAITRGDRARLLAFDAEEHPVALQLGGSNPKELAVAAKAGEDAGYDEVNLNCGCPSDRVASGSFGACLMLEPELVAECVAAMRAAVKVPVTVKMRVGVITTKRSGTSTSGGVRARSSSPGTHRRRRWNVSLSGCRTSRTSPTWTCCSSRGPIRRRSRRPSR
jgi:tRNA-dihydrouridine synthase A